MLTKRIIPCLDVKAGRVVKGVQFENIEDAGDPTILAQFYSENAADEVVFLDIAASIEERKIMIQVVEQTAKKIFVPMTVGGGIRSVEDAREVLFKGADKVAVNSAAVKRPELIRELAMEFGSQAVVLAIDARRETAGRWKVFTHGGTLETSLNALAWAKQGKELGAGEILVTSMDQDGTKSGFDCDLTREVSRATHIPVIASGGGGTLEHFLEVFTHGEADAALAASIFHRREIAIVQLKEYLREKGIPVRL